MRKYFSILLILFFFISSVFQICAYSRKISFTQMYYNDPSYQIHSTIHMYKNDIELYEGWSYLFGISGDYQNEHQAKIFVIDGNLTINKNAIIGFGKDYQYQDAVIIVTGDIIVIGGDDNNGELVIYRGNNDVYQMTVPDSDYGETMSRYISNVPNFGNTTILCYGNIGSGETSLDIYLYHGWIQYQLSSESGEESAHLFSPSGKGHIKVGALRKNYINTIRTDQLYPNEDLFIWNFNVPAWNTKLIPHPGSRFYLYLAVLFGNAEYITVNTVDGLESSVDDDFHNMAYYPLQQMNPSDDTASVLIHSDFDTDVTGPNLTQYIASEETLFENYEIAIEHNSSDYAVSSLNTQAGLSVSSELDSQYLPVRYFESDDSYSYYMNNTVNSDVSDDLLLKLENSSTNRVDYKFFFNIVDNSPLLDFFDFDYTAFSAYKNRYYAISSTRSLSG